MFRYVKGPNGFDLKKAHPSDAGWDLSSAGDYEIPPGDKVVVDTDIKVAIPEGYYGRVAPRSGLSVKNNIETNAGVIDSAFRNTVKVVLRNFGNETFKVNNGDRIAQLIITKIYTYEAVCVQSLDETDRGERGFGSSGVSQDGVSQGDVCDCGALL